MDSGFRRNDECGTFATISLFQRAVRLSWGGPGLVHGQKADNRCDPLRVFAVQWFRFEDRLLFETGSPTFAGDEDWERKGS